VNVGLNAQARALASKVGLGPADRNVLAFGPPERPGSDEARWGGWVALIRSVRGNRQGRAETRDDEEQYKERPERGWVKLDRVAPVLPPSGHPMAEGVRRSEAFIGGIEE
jgi:hypothetical protein